MKKRLLSFTMAMMLSTTMLTGCDILEAVGLKEKETEPEYVLDSSSIVPLTPVTTAAPTEPAFPIAGKYKLSTINGMSVQSYFEDLATKGGTDLETLLMALGVEDVDSLAEELGFTLYDDGTASFGHLQLDGIEMLQGDWYDMGDTLMLTIMDAQKTVNIDSNGNQTVSYSDKILNGYFENGVITARDDRGDLWVYSQKDNAQTTDSFRIEDGVLVLDGELTFDNSFYINETEEGEAGEALEVDSAVGSYKIDRINGMDAKSYYIDLAGDEEKLGYMLEMMDVSSIDTLEDDMSFTLQDDGTVRFAVTPSGWEEQTGTWLQDGETVTLKLNNPAFPEIGLVSIGGSVMQYGNGTVEYSFDDGTLSCETWFDTDLVFARTDD